MVANITKGETTVRAHHHLLNILTKKKQETTTTTLNLNQNNSLRNIRNMLNVTTEIQLVNFRMWEMLGTKKGISGGERN